MNYQQPTNAAVDEFLKITDDAANRPMFIHCTAAIRVGAFWMIRRVLRDGMTIRRRRSRKHGRSACAMRRTSSSSRAATSPLIRIRGYIAVSQEVERVSSVTLNSVEQIAETKQIARLHEQPLLVVR